MSLLERETNPKPLKSPASINLIPLLEGRGKSEGFFNMTGLAQPLRKKIAHLLDTSGKKS